jgi:hypothetical protein
LIHRLEATHGQFFFVVDGVVPISWLELLIGCHQSNRIAATLVRV